MSGQFPMPVNSMVHVTVRRRLAEVGTTLEANVNSPTAPEKSAGVDGKGLIGELRQPNLIDLPLFDVRLAEQTEAGVADHQVDHLAGGIERVVAGLLDASAGVLYGDDADVPH